MATRNQTRLHKERLKRDLRALCDAGSLLPGDPIPTARELAERHQLSRTVVMGTLAELIEEGLLYTVPRQGTFVGRPRQNQTEFYVLLLPFVGADRGGDEILAFLQTGFEDRIAQLGGTPLAMPLDKVTAHAQRGELPQLAGVFEPFPISRQEFETPFWSAQAPLPLVHFADGGQPTAPADVVSFDNVSGGRQATQHLLGQGYRRIAFLGLHTRERAQDDDSWEWSRQRELGWQGALQDAGLDADEAMSFGCPIAGITPIEGGLMQAARLSVMPVVQRILERGDIKAVVAANDATAMTLLNQLRAANVPHPRWPAIVGFDNMPLSSGHVMSSLRLPWEELGSAAAELLWERRHDSTNEATRQRRVAMRLIPRLTCRNDWSLMPHHPALTTVVASDPMLV